MTQKVTPALVAKLALNREFPTIIERNWLEKRAVLENPLVAAMSGWQGVRIARLSLLILFLEAVALIDLFITSTFQMPTSSSGVIMSLTAMALTVAAPLVALVVSARQAWIEFRRPQLAEFCDVLTKVYGWLRAAPGVYAEDLFAQKEEDLILDADRALANCVYRLDTVERDLEKVKATTTRWNPRQGTLQLDVGKRHSELNEMFDTLKLIGLAPHDEEYYEAKAKELHKAHSGEDALLAA